MKKRAEHDRAKLAETKSPFIPVYNALLTAKEVVNRFENTFAIKKAHHQKALDCAKVKFAINDLLDFPRYLDKFDTMDYIIALVQRKQELFTRQHAKTLFRCRNDNDKRQVELYLSALETVFSFRPCKSKGMESFRSTFISTNFPHR